MPVKPKPAHAANPIPPFGSGNLGRDHACDRDDADTEQQQPASEATDARRVVRGRRAEEPEPADQHDDRGSVRLRSRNPNTTTAASAVTPTLPAIAACTTNNGSVRNATSEAMKPIRSRPRPAM